MLDKTVRAAVAIVSGACAGGVTIATTANGCTVQQFHSFSGTTLVALAAGAVRALSPLQRPSDGE